MFNQDPKWIQTYLFYTGPCGLLCINPHDQSCDHDHQSCDHDHQSCDHHVIMQCMSKRLPEWGFQQYEVATSKTGQPTHVLWGIEDLRPPNVSHTPHNWTLEEEEIRESLVRHASPEGGDGGGAKLSFWEKYVELQVSYVLIDNALSNSTEVVVFYQ